MDYDRLKELKDEVLPRWEEVLSQITSPAKKSGEYVCPLCGHGKGGDGLKANPRSTKYGLKCFGGCGFSGDIIELVGRVEGLSSFPDQLKRTCYYLGIDTEDRPPKKTSKMEGQNQAKTERTNTAMDIQTNTYTPTHTDTASEVRDYSSYFVDCHNRITETDYLTKRGISKETIDLLGLGYDREAKPYGEKSSTRWEAVIIPYSKSYYTMRNLHSKTKKDRYGKPEGATARLYRTLSLREAKTPIFITEGELDAISIIDVGGEAVGLGSTTDYKLLIEAVKKTKPRQPLILALDNDEAGKTATETLSKELTDLKIEFYVINPYGDSKDANEALIANRGALTKEVREVESTIEAIKEEALREERESYLQKTVQAHRGLFEKTIEASREAPVTPTGFTILDSVLDGGLYHGLYCIGAITSLGKTTFVLQIVDQIARSGRDVFIYSLEMSELELWSKSVSRHTMLKAIAKQLDTKTAKTARGITDGARYEYYTDLELELIEEAKETYYKYADHIIIKEGIGDIGVLQIEEDVARHRRLFPEREAPIIVVDYLQILAPYTSEYIRASDKQITDKNVVELKRLSRDYKTTVLGISSFNRDNYNAPVNLASFKESGAIEYSSDVLIGLQYEGMDYIDGEKEPERNKRIRELKRTQETKGRLGEAQSIQLKVLKNRFGYKADVMYNFYPLFNYFSEDITKNAAPPQTNRKKY